MCDSHPSIENAFRLEFCRATCKNEEHGKEVLSQWHAGFPSLPARIAAGRHSHSLRRDAAATILMVSKPPRVALGGIVAFVLRTEAIIRGERWD